MKLPNIVTCIHACKFFTEKIILLKMCGPQIRICLFKYRPIASKQLNSLTTINTLSRLGDAVIKHSLWVQEFMGSIPGSNDGFLCLIFCFVVVFLLFVQKHIICHKIVQFRLQCLFI